MVRTLSSQHELVPTCSQHSLRDSEELNPQSFVLAVPGQQQLGSFQVAVGPLPSVMVCGDLLFGAGGAQQLQQAYVSHNLLSHALHRARDTVDTDSCLPTAPHTVYIVHCLVEYVRICHTMPLGSPPPIKTSRFRSPCPSDCGHSGALIGQASGISRVDDCATSHMALDIVRSTAVVHLIWSPCCQKK
jgi:hypothetical protein